MPYFICPHCGHRDASKDRTAGFSTRPKGCSKCGFGFVFELLDDYYPAPTAAFFVCDREERVIDLGKGSYELTGLTDEDVIGVLAAEAKKRREAAEAFRQDVFNAQTQTRLSASESHSALMTVNTSSQSVTGSDVTPTYSPAVSRSSPSLSFSQASPMPFRSVSVWSGFGTAGQLSQASPTPSPSASACAGLKLAGQLSHASPTPSPSESSCAGSNTSGHRSTQSSTSSLSSAASGVPDGYFEAFGDRDPETDAPMRTVALFSIASMTKPMVSVGIMMLVEDEALTLDTENKRFILDVEKDQLETAPGFDKDQWPNMADPAWAKAIHSYYLTQPHSGDRQA